MEIGPGTRAIVSGATRGIGRSTARSLAARGATVGLLARSTDELEALAAELPKAVALPADVADRDATQAAVSSFIDGAGGLELLVANAGVAHTGPFLELEPDQVDEMVQVNFVGTLNVVRLGLPAMLARGRGHVVVVSSGAALRSFPWTAVYGGTKAAQKGFAEALRHELSGSGVSLTTVYPGEVRTSLHAHERQKMPDWFRPGDAIPPEVVSEAIVDGVNRDRREVHVPGNVRLLGLNSLAPGLVDRLLTLLRGGGAAPRRY
ncbi:MAG: SDR family oxidoreductase [Solirubrobacterales bacterium]|nr:SDR family oxidoreductase [Solirubrobacterales bacterium]